MIQETIREQRKLFISVSINSKLSTVAKDGIYLSRFYIDQFEPKFLSDLLKNWETKADKSSFQKKLEDIVYKNLDTIEQEIKESLNTREHLITEIFQLFKQKYYSAMITLSLSQIDGIIKDITENNGFYNSNPENKKLHPNRLKYLDDDFYVNSFSGYELLNVNNRNDYELFKKKTSDMSLLNRHSILHGESTEFGHITNAIKTILLLTFISDLYRCNKE